MPPRKGSKVPFDLTSPITLTDKDREDLLGIVDSLGYKVLLKIVQGTCRGFTDALLNTDPANEKAVLSAHIIAQSSWLFLKSLREQVAAHVEAAFDEQRQVEQRLKELGREDFFPVGRPKVDIPEATTPLEVMDIT